MRRMNSIDLGTVSRCGLTSSTLGRCSGHAHARSSLRADTNVSGFPSPPQHVRSMFTLLQAGLLCQQWMRSLCLIAPCKVLTLDGWCDDIVRHVVRQPIMGVYWLHKVSPCLLRCSQYTFSTGQSRKTTQSKTLKQQVRCDADYRELPFMHHGDAFLLSR